MEDYLISYIKALMLKDYTKSSKIRKELEKLGMDFITLKVLIMDKELIQKARKQLEEENND